MCLIVFGWEAHPRYSLVVAGNRDEFFARPSAALSYWDDYPGVVGGRDVEKGGSWLASNVDGRWAAVTNFRDGQPAEPTTLSRGHLVSNYVTSTTPANRYADEISGPLPRYPGCNLLFGDSDTLYYLSNRSARDPVAVPEPLSPGVYGLSNHLLDTPWPKVERTRKAVRELLDSDQDEIAEDLFKILADRDAARDDELPETGVSRERERMLSAPFIVSEAYGTRASTVLLAGTDGKTIMQERTFGSGGIELERKIMTFVRG